MAAAQQSLHTERERGKFRQASESVLCRSPLSFAFYGALSVWLFRRIENLDTRRGSRQVMWAWAAGGFLVKQGVPVKDIPPAGLPLCAGQDYGKNLYPNSVQKKEFLEEFLCF